MNDIFISYSSEDINYTERLAIALKSEGLKIWWDRSIPIGKSYETIIEEALDEAKCVIIIWSKASVKSHWVRAEAAEAQRQAKLFPINIDGSRPPLIYRSLQTVDFMNWSGDINDSEFIRLVADIRAFIKKPRTKTELRNSLQYNREALTKINKPLITEKVDTNAFDTEVSRNPDNILSSEQIKQYKKKYLNKKGFIMFFVVLVILFWVVLLPENKKQGIAFDNTERNFLLNNYTPDQIHDAMKYQVEQQKDKVNDMLELQKRGKESEHINNIRG